MAVLDDWLADIPQQFQNKKNITILISAFAKQIQELYQVFEDILSKTTVDEAKGANLEIVGSIVSLTKKDAQVILRKGSNYDVDDELYRKVIKWRIAKNNTDCTYEEVVNSIKMLWNTDDITYRESIDDPCNIYIDIPTVGIDEYDPSIGRVLAVKPGGVSLIYSVGYDTSFDFQSEENITASVVLDDYWYLNGEYELDGSRELGPITVEEEL